jgi:hypothetical protein
MKPAPAPTPEPNNDSTRRFSCFTYAEAVTKAHAVSHTQINLDAFYAHLRDTYAELFVTDTDYAYSASKITPDALARKMTLGLAAGTANKEGKAIRLTCSHFSIPHTYKAIRAFFDQR